MFRNSIGSPLESGRPRLVSTIGTASTCPPILWLVTLGKLLPGYGTLFHVALSSTSIFGTLYDARPLRFVCHPDSRWQNCCGHWPSDGLNCLKKSSVPPQAAKMYISGCAATTPHSSSTTFPVLLPPWMVTSRRRAFTVTSTPLKLLDDPPMLSVNVWKLSNTPNFAGFTSRKVKA